MTMIILLPIVSFFLEGLFSNYFPVFTTYVFPLFTLTSLVIIYPYFYRHEERFYFFSAIVGLWYDIVYTKSFGYHLFFFLFLAFLLVRVSRYLKNNYVNVLFLFCVTLFLYRFGTYLFLVMFQELSFSFSQLYFSIISSFFINIIYLTILYCLINRIGSKFHLTKF